MRQVFPSHFSTIGCEAEAKEKPTATHELTDGQETPYSEEGVLVVGLA
jgi:hypothetical protein